MGARVDEQIHARTGGIVSDGRNLLAQKIGGGGAVFDVDAHGTDVQNTHDEICHRARIIRIAGLDVDRERHANDTRYVTGPRDPLIDAELLSLRITSRPCETRTGG